MPSPPETHRIIRRIIRVNHAGEHGAVAIYSAQIARASSYPVEIQKWLKETLEHEKRHQAKFLGCMEKRGAKPCRGLFVWKVGGVLLGSITSLGGITGVMICTAAVERTVRHHLLDQIDFLTAHDRELRDITAQILSEEEEHLRIANENHDQSTLNARVLSKVVEVCTEMMILLSTRGDTLRLKHVMALRLE